MKRALVIAAMLIGSAALAQVQTQTDAPPQKGVAVESVIVTAPRQRPEEALDHFIYNHAAPTPLLGKIARWKTGICPLTIGLPPNFNLFIDQRIIRVAMLAGAPLDSDEPCRPNVIVLATDRAQDLLDFIRVKRPALLGFHYKSHAAAIATMRLPVQAWYSTATEDFYGFINADIPALDITRALPGARGIPGAAHVSGNRAIGDGLKTEITAAIVIVDTKRIVGQQIGPLADYIAMIALSQAQSYDTCQDVPTINNLLAANCAAELKPAGLTDIDATYLRGLYKMDAGRSYLGERASIAYVMKKELGGY